MRQIHVLILCAFVGVFLLAGTNGKRGGGGGGSRSSGRGSSSGRNSASGSRASSGSGSIASSSGTRTRTITTGGKTRTYTYSSSSSRNYNNGARYYMRRTTTTSTSSFGYSYYRSGSYYSSGYGYRMYYPPTYYYPMYVGYSYYYYPPMFYRYHQSDRRYWNGNRPRYTCRNDNAFWPLENQTSEFVDGRPPALDFSQFDQDLPDPDDSSSSTTLTGDSGGRLTELNSFLINMNLTADDDYSNDDDDGSTDEPVTVTTRGSTSPLWTTAKLATTMLRTTMIFIPPSEANKRKIQVYNYFACPDGKDPDEIYCCGPPTAQYCCAMEDTNSDSMSLGVVIALSIAVLVFVSIIVTLCKMLRQRCCGVHHVEVITVPGETVAMTTQTIEYIPAPMGDGFPVAAPPMAGQPYPPGVYPSVPAQTSYPATYPGYQPVPGPPPGYVATQNPSDQFKGAYPTAAMPMYPPPGSAYSTGPTGSPYPPVTMPYPNNG